MEQEIEWLKNRVAVLEEMVECLLGKAIADSGEMALLLSDIVDMNRKGPATGDKKVIDDHLHLSHHMQLRMSGALFRSEYFPRQWKHAKRRRETNRSPSSSSA